VRIALIGFDAARIFVLHHIRDTIMLRYIFLGNKLNCCPPITMHDKAVLRALHLICTG